MTEKIEPVKTPALRNLTEDQVKATLGEFIEWGQINFESANGNIHSNCKAVEFATAEEMNTWFSQNLGVFATQIFPMNGKIICICNRKLDEEGQAMLADQGEAIRRITADLTKARQDAKIAEEEELQKRAKELERLTEVGKKCEHNHGAVIKENQKLKQELRDLRKGKKS